MRMIAQFELAGEKKALVVGTDHAAEAVTGFFTKFGDGAADIDAYLLGETVADDVAERIEDYWRRSRHKRALPVKPADEWWREEV